MVPWLTSEFGNPSSLHAEGRRAKDAIDEARATVSRALGCLFAEVVFTSSGTEAANLAILGAALANPDPSRSRILLGAAEHHCVLHTKPLLERLGYRVELIPVDPEGRVTVTAVEALVGDDVFIVSVMHANNELGTINPVHHISGLAHALGALVHCDAVQTFLVPDLGGLVEATRADLISISGHKVNGPKGVGALYQRAGVKLKPLTLGGGQEREMRAGTENVAAIVGFGAAVAWRASLSVRGTDVNPRDIFLSRLVEAEFIQTASSLENLLSGHAHVRLPGVDAETMLIRLDRMGVGASSGAACSSGSLEPSHVLLACSYSMREAKEGLRFTFGLDSTVEQAEEAARRVIAAAEMIIAARR